MLSGTLQLLAAIFFTLLSLTSMRVRAWDLTIFQTSDLHSHFTNRDSTLRLGGYARLATKLRELKEQNPNALLLDAGDFTEGNVYYSAFHGAQSVDLLRLLSHDAIALGNHDWYNGPTVLEAELKNQGLPILSANLDFSGLPHESRLREHIRPYLIKTIEGHRVCILGLSTNSAVFKDFFKPVKILNPLPIAKEYVRRFRKTDKCEAVVVVSHLGIHDDEKLAHSVPGIDFIAGGHSHILLRAPALIGSTVISHVGAWGQYIGEVHLEVGQRTYLTSYLLHPVSEATAPDPVIEQKVDEARADIEKSWGPIFKDQIIQTEMDLPGQDLYTDNTLAQLATDAMREFTGADIAFENPTYVANGLTRGLVSSVDVFNCFPYILNPITGKAWTVKVFRMRGWALRILLNLLFQRGINLKVSNAEIILDQVSHLRYLHSFKIGGQAIKRWQKYRVAGSDGVEKALEFLRERGINLGDKEVQDTRVEAWRVIASYLRQMSPLSPVNLPWRPRIRSVQPDLLLRPEELNFTRSSAEVTIRGMVHNIGINPAALSFLRGYYFNPQEEVLSEKRFILLNPRAVPPLEGGHDYAFQFAISAQGLAPGRYGLVLTVDEVPTEIQIKNNKIESYFDVDRRQ